MDILRIPPFDYNDRGPINEKKMTEKRAVFQNLKEEHELMAGVFANEAVQFVIDGEYDAFLSKSLIALREKNGIKVQSKRSKRKCPSPPPPPPSLCI